MKRFLLFMVIFGLAFAGVQKVGADDISIPCLKSTNRTFYDITLKSYEPSASEKSEQNLSESKDVSFWEITAWKNEGNTAETVSCGTWNEKTYDIDSCEGSFRFHRDMGRQDVFGFYWIRSPNPPASIGVLQVLQSTVEINQDVRIYFTEPAIKTASYTASDGQHGDFSRDANGYFDATLKFSSAGSKKVRISGTNLCGVAISESEASITVRDPCEDISPPSIPNLKATAVKQDVSISFGVNPNIETASYKTSDGQSGTFTRDAGGTFKAALQFSTAGNKTITVDAVNSCGKKASESVDVVICSDNSLPSIVNDTVYFGADRKTPSSNPRDLNSGTITTDLLLFDFRPQPLVRETTVKHLVSFDYTADPSNPVTEIRISDYFREIPILYDSKVQSEINSGSFSQTIILSDGLYDLLIEITNGCGTYRKIFSVQFQRP